MSGKKNFAFGKPKTGPGTRFLRLRRKTHQGAKYYLALGEISRRNTITPPAAAKRYGAKTPCRDKPHIAFGECYGKQPFQPKCCASTKRKAARQLINALGCVPIAPETLPGYTHSSTINKKCVPYLQQYLILLVRIA